MSRRMLWCSRTSDLNYVGNDGNVNLKTGGSGTFSAWVNTPWKGNVGFTSPDYARLFYAELNATNYAVVHAWHPGGSDVRLVFTVCVAGTPFTLLPATLGTAWPNDVWHHVAATWDFTGGTGNGIMRLYLDGNELGTAVTNANPLGAEPGIIYIGAACGPTPDGTGWKGFIQNVAIWNGVMTGAQVAAGFAAGHRKPVAQADGTGTLLFSLPCWGTLIPTVHAGTATATISDLTQVGFLDDGATTVGNRFSAHFGTGTDRERIRGGSVLWPYDFTFSGLTDNAGWASITTAATAMHWCVSDLPNWKRAPVIIKFRMCYSGLLLDEYFTLSAWGAGAWRFHKDRICESANPTKYLAYIPANDQPGGGVPPNKKWVDLWFRFPGSAYAGIPRYSLVVVNKTQMLETVANWPEAANWMRFNFTATTMPTSTVTLDIESIEVYGPTDYQVSDTPRDDFLQAVYSTALTGKVWRASNVERTLNTPTKYASNPLIDTNEAWVQAICDIANPLTLTQPVVWQADATHGRLVWPTKKLDGTRSLHYFDTADGLTFTADPANPIVADMRTFEGPQGAWDKSVIDGLVLFSCTRGVDGKLAFSYIAGNQLDGGATGMILGLDDVYSLTPAHKYAGNPVLRHRGTADGAWYNRDQNITVLWKNPWPSGNGRDIYFGVGYGLTNWTTSPYTLGPLRWPMMFQSSNLLEWRPISDTQLALPLLGYSEGAFGMQVARDRFLIVTGANTQGLTLLASEDGIVADVVMHPYVAVGTQAWEGAAAYNSYRHLPAIRLGDVWYWYYYVVIDDTHSGYAVATSRYNGLAHLGLTAGQTSGWLETCALTKPADGWGALLVNADPQAGALTVEVLDGVTDLPFVGYSAGDCSAIGNAVEGEVTWAGGGLDDLTNASIRLRFTLTRPDAGDASPILYAYQADPVPPTIQDVGGPCIGSRMVRGVIT